MREFINKRKKIIYKSGLFMGKLSKSADMSRALLTILVVLCFLAQGYGGKPEEKPCQDADSCLSLEEVKNEAYRVLNKAVEEGMMQLNKVREEGGKIQKRITENNMTLEMDKMVVRELINMSEEGNKAFEEALKAGKDLPVFECIVECELSARKQFPQKVDQCKNELVTLQKEPVKQIDSTLQKVTEFETKLKDTQQTYMKKIRESFSNVGVSWNRDQGLKALATVLKGSENLGGEFPGILENYEKSAQGVVKNCQANFAKVTEEARECMKGCMER